MAQLNKFVIYYYPILYCREHSRLCSVYFQDKKIQNKLYLNKEKGDELINNPSFWTLIKFRAKKFDEGLNSKLHVDDEFLLALHRKVIVESKYIFNIAAILL